MPELPILLIANVILSAAIGGILYFTRSEGEAIVAALTVLIAFSPFNLVLGSTLVMRRVAQCVERLNIRMNSTNALLKLCSIDTAAFSMNKMITTGEYFITDLIPEGLTQAGLLSIAAAAEKNSTHPLGRKIFETAEARGLRIDSAMMFNEIEGLGVEALVNGTTVRVGRANWIKKEGAGISAELRTKIDQIAAKSRTPLVLSMGRTARGVIGLKDEIDERAKIFLDRLKYNGIENVLLTAEPKRKANAIIKGLPIENVRAELLPEDKAREIQLMQARGKIVAAIGSEERDRPAYAAADVSVLISDVDSDAADFIIRESSQFFELRSISLRTKKILRRGRLIVFATWALMIPLVAKMLVDAESVPYPPLIATVGTALCSVATVLNARKGFQP